MLDSFALRLVARLSRKSAWSSSSASFSTTATGTSEPTSFETIPAISSTENPVEPRKRWRREVAESSPPWPLPFRIAKHEGLAKRGSATRMVSTDRRRGRW